MADALEQDDAIPRVCAAVDAFPTGIVQFSTTWLTNALRASRTIVRARVVAFKTESVPHPGYTSECARIELEYDRAETGAPASLFAKVGAHRSDMLRNLRTLFHAEVRFYQDVAPQLGTLVPKCFFAGIHPDGLHFVLLLEDLAPSRLMVLEPDPLRTAPNIETALRGLAAVHAVFWNRHRTGSIQGLHCPYLDVRPSKDWLVHVRATVTKRHGTTVPKLLLEIADLYVNDIHAIAATCVRHPLTLCHSDFHPAQVFLPSERGGRLCIVDWFGVNYAEPASNVQRMLLVTLRSEHRRAHEDHLLRSYQDALRMNGVSDYDFDTLLDRYRGRMIDSVAHQLALAAFGNLDQIDRQLGHLGLGWRDICFTRIVTACEEHGVLEVLRRDARLGRRELQQS